MAEKDITARDLVSYADVFADIVNGTTTILNGGQPFLRVRPEEFVDVPTRTISTPGDKVRGQERDVVKIWTAGETVLCLMGLENRKIVKNR